MAFTFAVIFTSIFLLFVIIIFIIRFFIVEIIIIVLIARRRSPKNHSKAKLDRMSALVNYPAVKAGASRFIGTACSLATACRAVLAGSGRSSADVGARPVPRARMLRAAL